MWASGRWVAWPRLAHWTLFYVHGVQQTSWLLDTSSPDDVARANFSIVRRGFDPIEVQGFARSVSAEIIRLQNQIDDLNAARRDAEIKLSERITEAAVAGYLGQETARMLQAARETSDSLMAQATERSERLQADARAEAERLLTETKATASRLRADAEQYARTKRAEVDRYSEATRAEADRYSQATRAEADEYATRTSETARADGDASRRQAAVEAERVVREAMDQRAGMLREMARRRDLAAAQVRAMLSGRDVIVDSLEQVRLASIELIDGLEEISVAPADFVSLDPDIDGLVMDRGAALAVRRGGSSSAARSHGAVRDRDARPRAGLRRTGTSAHGRRGQPALRRRRLRRRLTRANERPAGPGSASLVAASPGYRSH